MISHKGKLEHQIKSLLIATKTRYIVNIDISLDFVRM